MDEIRIGSLGFARLASAADNRIESANLFEETSLVQDDLAYNTLSASLFSTSRAVLDTPYGAAVQFYRNGSLHSTFYKEAVKRTGPNTYSLSAVSRVGLLERMEHRGGIYTGQTAGEVICGICGSVPVQVKSSLEGMKLYGWLPYVKPPDSSARDNLAQVLFAIGASVKTDLHGNLRVEGLWNGMTGTVSRERVYSGGNVEYGEKYTAVSVTEHQYIQGTEEAQLFEGTAQEGDLITFDEPMHSLKATGFSILDSGANYARVSAGTGTLTGKKYIHNTRQVIKTLGAAQAENVKAVNDATLVSLVNSDAVANRLAAFYRCEEIIDVPVVAQRETPGDVLGVYHPYDRKMVPACLQSADISLSNTLKAQEKLLVGFVPLKEDQIVVYDNRELLTGNGTWTVPEGVTQVKAVLIGGGGAGADGANGSDGGFDGFGANTSQTKQVSPAVGQTASDTASKSATLKAASPGGGGDGGAAGIPGRIYQTTLKVNPGQSFQFSCGSAGGSNGATGEDTTIGELSSVFGEAAQIGYTDVTTGIVYAKGGASGTAGGKGGIPGSDGESTEQAGGIGYPGNSDSHSKNGSRYFGTAYNFAEFNGTVSYSFSGAGGGGAGGGSGDIAGDEGNRAPSHTFQVLELGFTLSSGGSACASGFLVPPNGGRGGNGAIGQQGETFGSAGSGGGGGGGGGAPGSASLSSQITLSIRSHNDEKYVPGSGNAAARINLEGGRYGRGGLGGAGGSGAPGCIILYYGIQKVIRSGPVATHDGKFLLDKHSRRFIV